MEFLKGLDDVPLHEVRPQRDHERIEIDPNSTTPACDLAEAVVRNSNLSLHVRMRAMRELMNKERPDLRAMALVPTGGDFAEMLDRAIERSDRARIVGNNAKVAKVIEHEGSSEGPTKVQGIRRV